MATTSNAVQITASLTSSLLTNPPIGQSGSMSLSFTDGDSASDTYVNVTTATALNADIVGGGFALISNPALISGVANTVDVLLKISTTAIGTLKPGALALIPLDSGTVITGTASSGAVNIGVTVIECDPNA